LVVEGRMEVNGSVSICELKHVSHDKKPGNMTMTKLQNKRHEH